VILKNLQSVRKARGLTQKKLADMLLFTERTIIGWESGKPTTENNAKRVAATLKVKVKELVS
jgi:transcriptional regulator with XRE-family HTH domain